MAERDGMSQTDVVVYGIKKMILDGDLAPGDQLPIEKDLAPRLGVSRSSLREGVRALSIMGVLETRQGAGTFVTALDASLLLAPMGFVVDLQHSDGVTHVQAVRRILETAAVARAAVRMGEDVMARAERILDESALAVQKEPADHEVALECDLRFHRLIAQASGNTVLEALIEALSARTARGRLWRSLADERAAVATVDEHRGILAAIRVRDFEAAQVRMANHLLSVEEFLASRPPVGDGSAE